MALDILNYSTYCFSLNLLDKALYLNMDVSLSIIKLIENISDHVSYVSQVIILLFDF